MSYKKLPNLLHRYPTNIRFLTSVLERIPAGEQLAAVKVRDSRGNTLLHLAAGRTDAFQHILALYPPEEPLEAVMQSTLSGETVLYSAGQNPETMKAVLALYPKQARYDAVMTTTHHGETVLDRMVYDGDSTKAILESLPETDRVKVLRNSVGKSAICTQWFKALDLIPDSDLFESLLLTNKEGNTLLHAIAEENPGLLYAVLGRLSLEDRLNALAVAGKEKMTVLECMAARKPEIFCELLKILENRAFDAVKGDPPHRRPVLFFGAHRPEILKILLDLYRQNPSEAVPSPLWRDVTWHHAEHFGITPLQNLARHPQSLRMILDDLPQSPCLDALKVRDEKESGMLHYVAKHPESLALVLSQYPEHERLEAVLLRNEYGISVLDFAKNTPDSLMTILRLLPEEQRHEALHATDKDGVSVLATVKATWKSMDAIHVLVPSLTEESAPAAGSTA